MHVQLVDQLLRTAGVGHAEIVAHEIALGHALGADDGETTEIVGHVEVGVEGHRRAVGVFDDGGLEIDDVAIAVEDLVGA